MSFKKPEEGPECVFQEGVDSLEKGPVVLFKKGCDHVQEWVVPDWSCLVT